MQALVIHAGSRVMPSPKTLDHRPEKAEIEAGGPSSRAPAGFSILSTVPSSPRVSYRWKANLFSGAPSSTSHRLAATRPLSLDAEEYYLHLYSVVTATSPTLSPMRSQRPPSTHRRRRFSNGRAPIKRPPRAARLFGRRRAGRAAVRASCT